MKFVRIRDIIEKRNRNTKMKGVQNLTGYEKGIFLFFKFDFYYVLYEFES